MITTEQARCFGGPWDGLDVDAMAWRVRVRWHDHGETRYTIYNLRHTEFGWRYFEEAI